MSQPRWQPTTGGVSSRRSTAVPAERCLPTAATPPPPPPPTAQRTATNSYGRRVASATSNHRERPIATSKPESSERPVPTRKRPVNPPRKTEPVPRQPVRHGPTGNSDKRPPFVVGTGSRTAYRAGGGCCAPYATTRTESRSRPSATSSKDGRAASGSGPCRDSGTESKMSRAERLAAVHAAGRMTFTSNSTCDMAQQSRDRAAELPDAADSSKTVVVADPLPEITGLTQHRLSAEECIKKVAEKLNEFVAVQNDTSENSTLSNSRQRPSTGNDLTKDSCRHDVTESPRPLPLAHDGGDSATISGGNDVSSTSKPVGGTSKKTTELHRGGSTKLSAACRPSPTRSSLLRQALNCPGSTAGQQRVPPRPTRPTVARTNRSSTEHSTENQQLLAFLRQHTIKPRRVDNVHPSHDTAAQPTK